MPKPIHPNDRALTLSRLPSLRLVRGPAVLPSATPDAGLIRAAAAGDTRAQEQLYRAHAPRLFGLLFRLLGGSHDVEDVLQDTFITAFDDLSTLREPERLSAWLNQVAVRHAHRRFRRRRLERLLGRMPWQTVSLIAVARADLTPEEGLELSRLDEALSQLSTKLRTAWLLRHVEGCTLDETAIACDCSRATLKRWLQRAEDCVNARIGASGGSHA